MHPILFELGPFAIRSYGVCVALAFVIGFYLLETEAKRSAFYPGKILDMGLWVLVAGILGARLLHVLVNLNYYCANPLEMLLFWRGGLAIYGGLISGILAGIVFVRKNAMPFFLTGDFFAPYLALGQAIGRIGCFLNGCCFGKVGLHYPAQLCAVFLLLIIFIILKLMRNLKAAPGFIFGFYLILYSGQRFFVDFLRDDLMRYAFNFTISQFISVFIFLGGILIIRWRKSYFR